MYEDCPGNRMYGCISIHTHGEMGYIRMTTQYVLSLHRTTIYWYASIVTSVLRRIVETELYANCNAVDYRPHHC